MHTIFKVGLCVLPISLYFNYQLAKDGARQKVELERQAAQVKKYQGVFDFGMTIHGVDAVTGAVVEEAKFMGASFTSAEGRVGGAYDDEGKAMIYGSASGAFSVYIGAEGYERQTVLIEPYPGDKLEVKLQPKAVGEGTGRAGAAADVKSSET